MEEATCDYCENTNGVEKYAVIAEVDYGTSRSIEWLCRTCAHGINGETDMVACPVEEELADDKAPEWLTADVANRYVVRQGDDEWIVYDLDTGEAVSAFVFRADANREAFRLNG